MAPEARRSRSSSDPRVTSALGRLDDLIAERLDPSAFHLPGIMRRPRLTVVRPEDLLVVAFEFRNLGVRIDDVGDGPAAFLSRTDETKQAYLIVHFQPQNIAEQAFFETTPANDLKLAGKLNDDGSGEARPDRDHPSATPKPTGLGPPTASALPVQTLIAGPSQLVFKVPAGATIRYTTAGLLDAIRSFELSVGATALPPDPPRIFVRPEWVGELTEVLARTGRRRLGPIDRVRARARVLRWEDETDLLPVTMRAGAALLSETALAAGAAPIRGTGGGADVAPGRLEATLEGEAAFRRVVDRIHPDQIEAILGWLRRHPRLAQPRDTETALELPFRLILSPNRYGAWAHSPAPVSSPSTGRTELWHTRLATRQETDDGLVIEEADHRLRTVRAVWARSGSEPPDPQQAFDTDPANSPGHSNEPFRMSLDPADRFDIVHLSANFNIRRSRTRYYRPVPVDVDRLLLASLGAWIDSRGRWDPPTPLEVEEWRHRGTMARDHYVRVVYKGYLWPFGHRASVVKVTERKLHPPATPGLQGSPAILRQRMYIVVRQPVLTYRDPGLKNAAGHRFDRQFPFTQVRITTLVTPNLDDPMDTDYAGKGQSLFWPYVGGAPFQFHLVAEDLEASKVEFTAPLVFVSNAVAWNTATLNVVRQDYEETLGETRATVSLNGQRMALAPEREPGDTLFEADALGLGVEILSKSQLSTLGEDRPQFYPRLRRARIVVPVVKGFTGSETPTVVAFAEEFLRDGFPGTAAGHPNPGEVFLKVAASQISLDFSGGGDKVGAFVQPNLDVAGLSRSLGPVGGTAANLANLAAGNFDPAQFFDALKARLFGVVDLGELIQSVGVEAEDLVPKFVTEAISAVESFTAELARLEARIDELKNQADAAAGVPAAVKAQVAARQAAIAAKVGDVASAIDQLIDGTDATVDLRDALDGLNVELQATLALLDALGAAVPSDFRQSVASVIDGVLTEVGEGAVRIAEFVTRLRDALKLVEELTMRFGWKPQVQDWPTAGAGAIFRAKNTKSNADAVFTIAAELQAKTKLRPEPRYDVACRLHNFTLNLIGEESFILLHFNKLEFTAKSGMKPDVNVEFDDIEFTGVLSFVETLRTLIPLDGFSDPPALDVSEKGISASYSMALPDVAIGVFSLQNLSLGAGFNVPFLLDPLTVRFNFCERESPFLLTVSMFGGGGFFAITLDPDGVEILEAAFEFGASLSVNLGVASGGVTVMAGIYYRMEVDEATLTGYFRLAGEVDVLGLISACIELYLGLAYEFASGKCAGTATITIEVSIAFFSTSVSISAERKFAGSNGDPTFAELMGPGPEFTVDPWTKYCEAFA
jgi:hypothetical protein